MSRIFLEPGNILFALLCFASSTSSASAARPASGWRERAPCRLRIIASDCGSRSRERSVTEPRCSRAAWAFCSFSGARTACACRIAWQRPSSSAEKAKKRKSETPKSLSPSPAEPRICEPPFSRSTKTCDESAEARTFFVPAYPPVFRCVALLPQREPGIIGVTKEQLLRHMPFLQMVYPGTAISTQPIRRKSAARN